MKLITCFIFFVSICQSKVWLTTPFRSDEANINFSSERNVESDKKIEKKDFVFDFETEFLHEILINGENIEVFNQAFEKYFIDLFQINKLSDEKIYIKNLKFKLIPSSKLVWFGINAECTNKREMNKCQMTAKTCAKQFDFKNFFPYLVEIGNLESVIAGLKI